MDLDKILNLALNKALIGKDRIKQINSNEIADFVNKYLEAINYTRCCTTLKDKKVTPFEDWFTALGVVQVNPNCYQRGNTTYNHALMWQEYKKSNYSL